MRLSPHDRKGDHMAHGLLCFCKKCTGGNFKSRSGKSSQSKQQSANRKANQQARGSGKFGDGSNVHNGASRSQSGQPKRGRR